MCRRYWVRSVKTCDNIGDVDHIMFLDERKLCPYIHMAKARGFTGAVNRKRKGYCNQSAVALLRGEKKESG